LNPVVRTVKRLLPHSLLGRAILIIVMPLILLQVVSTWVFYDRHWQTITRRLASAVAGETELIMDTMRQFPGAEHERWVLHAAADLGMRIEFKRGDKLPREAPYIGRGILDQRLSNALSERLREPYHLDTHSYSREVRIRVQMPDGVLDLWVPTERLFSPTTYIFVMWMVGTSFVLFAVATVFMRNQVKPIRRLAAAVDSFGKGRDTLDFKVEGATEIRRAAAAFNLMRERIQRMISQRTEMLAGVSHDLRTPLTRMKLELEMAKDSPAILELRADVAEMEKMVEGYLAFARGEGGEAAETTNLSEMIAEVANGARRNGAQIAVEADGDLTVTLRPNAFKRCLTNLVANAALHAENIGITAARKVGAIEILVDDDGPGIPPEMREDVFKPFFRLDSSRNPETGGTGLGLAIARDVVRGHGGELSLHESPAGGVRARVRLPL
jgi:two-component system osmolarity sensor histidine kinase EnvZ